MDKVLAEKPQVRRTDHQGKNVAEYFDDEVVYQLDTIKAPGLVYFLNFEKPGRCRWRRRRVACCCGRRHWWRWS